MHLGLTDLLTTGESVRTHFTKTSHKRSYLSPSKRRSTRCGFPRVKLGLSEPGAFSSENQRPITCLNNVYKWFTSCLNSPLIECSHLNEYDLMERWAKGTKAGCRPFPIAVRTFWALFWVWSTTLHFEHPEALFRTLGNIWAIFHISSKFRATYVF